MQLNEGIHEISAEDYHKDPCPEPSLSRSIIHKLLTQAPIKSFMAHPRLNPEYEADSGDGKFDIGSAAHALLLEGIDNAHVIDADNWRKNESQVKRDEARYLGKIPLLRKEYDKVIVMVEAAERQIKACSELQITDLRADGDSELTFIWSETDDIGRQSWNRVRTDWRSKDQKIIFDYKTTGLSADPNEFSKYIFNMGYDIQESYYKRGAKAVSGVKPKFVFVVQETEPPHLCSFIALSPEFQEIGHQKVDYGLFMWNECLSSGKWPGYPNKLCWVEPPGWAMAAWESKAQSIGI